MKTEVIDHSPTRKELKIEIDAETVRAAYQRVSNLYARQANVPGFRKGHTPTSVVQTRFKNEIRGEVLRELVPQAVSDAVVERQLHVVGEPEIHLDNDAGLEDFGKQPVSIHAHVEVLPEVALGEYKGLEAARRVRPVTDESVEQVIKGLLENSASLQPVEERGAELGDTVTVDVQGRFIDPPADEDINVEDVDVLLGGEGVVDEFTNNLLGVRPDDVKTFTVKYASDFSSKGLAGKEIEYTATVSAVRRKETPEMDDEWAKSLGEEIESVEQLRERVRKNLSEHAEYESGQRLRNDVLARLIEAHQFEVPESLVEQQTQRLLEAGVRDMMQRGFDPRSQEMNWDAMRDMIRPQATHDLRGSFLLERIADAEQIEVSDEEIETEINALAEGMRQTPEQVRAALTKQGGERSIADRLRHRKALDIVVDNATVRDEEWRDEEDAEAAEAITQDESAEGEESAGASAVSDVAPGESSASGDEAETRERPLSAGEQG
ncbi:MAG TPA: trigger factor [Pyrinomonadaceae bacterium]|jgi:trigger factor